MSYSFPAARNPTPRPRVMHRFPKKGRWLTIMASQLKSPEEQQKRAAADQVHTLTPAR